MTQRARILVVDDEMGPRESMRMIMKSEYDVITAESGGEALDFLDRESVDMVTLDLNMPDMHGIEVLKRIRSRDEAVPVVIVTGYATLATAQQAIRYGAFDYITKPFELNEILSVAARAVRQRRLHENMREALAVLGRGPAPARAHPLEEARARYADVSLMDFIEVLSRTLEEKNCAMHRHSVRVDRYARRVARVLGMTAAEQEELRIAAFLHDIGKIGISNDILNKCGPLSPAEWAEIKEHPGRGVEILRPLCLPDGVLQVILHHHESFDGTGYPAGLRGAEIPVGARILRVVDAYDAMISTRPYREARSPDWVVEELHRCSGTEFDPAVTRALIRVLRRREEEILPRTREASSA